MVGVKLKYTDDVFPIKARTLIAPDGKVPSAGVGDDLEAAKWITKMDKPYNGFLQQVGSVDPESFLCLLTSMPKVTPAGGAGGTTGAPKGLAIVDCRWVGSGKPSVLE